MDGWSGCEPRPPTGNLEREMKRPEIHGAIEVIALWQRQCWIGLGHDLPRKPCGDDARSPRRTRSTMTIVGFAWNASLISAIEYVVNDWTAMPPSEHSVVDGGETRRLSADEEASLFRRMNFLKHRAERLRQLIDDDYCPRDTLDAIAMFAGGSPRGYGIIWCRCFPSWRCLVARPTPILNFVWTN